MGSPLLSRIPLLVLCLSLLRSYAANWAQVSGLSRQNTGTSRATPWSKRWGFAFTVVDFPGTENVDPRNLPPERKPRMYVLGGDDYVSDTVSDGRAGTYRDDFFGRPLSPNKDEATSKYYPSSGGGSLLNDVWWSSGAQWDVFADYRAGNGFGEPLPRLSSRTEWESAPDWPGIPTEEVDGWREYLGCCHASRTYICFSPDLLCGNGDPYLSQRRWSPRRGHRAVTVNLGSRSVVVVMGGRARSLETMTGTELTGGFLGDPYDPTIAQRERSILTSDTWVSEDGGMTWDFTNGGCYVNQLEHAKAPGSIISECETDKNCTDAGMGNAECVDAGTPLHPNRRMCVCKHWSPRERFAASVLNGVIYVGGGVMYEQRNLCGRFACGTESATFLDDLWISEDVGRSWTQISRRTLLGNRFGRADHALTFLTDRWWLFGGRGQEDAEGSESIDKLYNDAYQSPPAGNEFVLNSTTSPWLARAAFRVVPHPTARAMYLIGGEVIQKVDAFTVAPPTAVEKVDRAAARAPTNVNRIQSTSQQEVRLPGFVVNNIRLTSTDDTWVYYQDDQAALGSQDFGPLGGRRWYQDFSADASTSHEYVWVDMPLDHVYFNYSQVLLTKLYALKNSLGKQALATIYDLATINREAVLAFLTPEGAQRSKDLPPFLPEICSLRETARALVDRCAPRGRGYDDQFYRDGPYAAIPKALSITEEVPETGCEGQVITVDWDAVDVVCRQRFSPRRSFGAGLMGGKVYVVGGYESRDFFSNEAWYRDEVPPQAAMSSTPADQTSESLFRFDANEAGCVFEIRAWDHGSGRMLRNWTKVTYVYDGIRLNEARRPTRVELRAIDPAGNRDSTLRYSSSELGPRNVHVWAYIPPFPLLELILAVIFGLAFIGACIFFYRRWQKKKAMERYMAKRLARKLKQQQEDNKEEKKKKTKKKKKKEVRQSTTEEDEEAKNRFKALLEKRAQERLEEEYNQLNRRKTAKEQFKHDQLMASRQTDASKTGLSALETYKEELKKGRGAFDRTEQQVQSRDRMIKAQSSLDEDDVRVRAVNGPGVPAGRGRRPIAGEIAEPGEHVNRALRSSIARKALSSAQAAKSKAGEGEQTDTDVSLPGQVEKKERTGPVALSKQQGPAPPVWRPGGIVRRTSSAPEHDVPVDWVNKSTRRLSPGASASPEPRMNRGARAGAGAAARPAGAAAVRPQGSDAEGKLPGQV